MKFIIYTLILFSVISLSTLGQPGFEKSFGNNSSYDEFMSVSRTPDGGYAFWGNTSNTTTLLSNLFLLKTDQDGNLMWSKTFSFPIDVFATKVVSNNNGELFLTGYTYENNPPYDDIILIKADPTGNIIWSHRYGGADIDEGNDMAMDDNGDLIMAGYTYSFGTTLKSGYAIKVNSNGGIIWSKTFAQNVNQEFNGVSVVSGNNYVFTGLTQRTPGINFDGFVVKTDSAGIIVWGKSSGGTSTETFYHSYEDQNGTLYVSGGSSTGTTGGTLDGLVVSYNSTGNRTLTKTYGTAAVDRAYSIADGPAGMNEFIISGHTSNSSAHENNLLLYIDKTTGVLNNSVAAGSVSGNSRAYSLYSDGQTAVQAGYIFTPTDSLGSAYIVKYNYSISPCNSNPVNFMTATPTFTDSVGVNVGNAVTTIDTLILIENIFSVDTTLLCTTNSIDEFHVTNEIILSPNPSTHLISIQTKEMELKKGFLTITDFRGAIVKSINFTGSTIEIKIDDLSAGIYIIQLVDEGFSSKKKFVKINE